jgi:hypothetical protein
LMMAGLNVRGCFEVTGFVRVIRLQSDGSYSIGFSTEVMCQILESVIISCA